VHRRPLTAIAVAGALVVAGSAAAVRPASGQVPTGVTDPPPVAAPPGSQPPVAPGRIGGDPSSAPGDPLGPHAPPPDGGAPPGGPGPAPGPPGRPPADGPAPAPPAAAPAPVATVDLAAVRRLDASLDLAVASRRLADADAALAAASRRRDVAAGAHRVAADEAARRKDRLREYAVRIYKGGDRFGDLAVMAGAENLTDLARRQVLLAAADETEVRRYRSAVEAERHLAAALESAEADRAAVAAARDVLAERRDAARRARSPGARLDGWGRVAEGPLVQGPSRLTAEEIAAWFRSTGRVENTTVPIEELARMYLEEGRDEGVRGDIAFAQSILETGGFHFASGGKVLTAADNNFAGIGACDSCARGWSFAGARLGVRQQVQLLRAYADRGLTSAALAHPPVRSRPELLGVRGCCEGWLGLDGVWATGAGYGERILQIYSAMARYALVRR